MSDRASAAVSKATGAPDPLIGRLINDRFKISALIARGGMGKVYRAEQAPLGRVCAIKVLNPNYAGEHDPEFHKRFFLEASIASKLTHPNTVTIFDYGRTDDDIYYMAMEYLEGHTLHRAIREAGHFPEERAAHVARQICRALREAHSLGVIHRDLKPANIFLVEHGDESDFVKVLDFGLVKNVSETKGEDLTQTGLFMGSPKYMAPEQIRGDRVDARTDIYALGIILYEMVTGKVPFDRPNSVNILMAHVNEEAPPLRQMNPNIQISPQLEDTIARCMAKDVDQRLRSMDEVLAALKRIGGAAMTATVSGIGATGEYRSLSGSGGRPAVPSTNPQGPVSSSSGSHNAAFLSPSSSEPGVIPAPLATSADSSAVPIVSQAPRSGSKSVLLLAVIGCLGIVGAVAFFALHGQPQPLIPTGPTGASSGSASGVNGASGTPTTPAAETDVPAPTPPPPAPLAAKVRFISDPDGASIKEDDVEICTSTPCDVPYKGGDADPTKSHTVKFVKHGYKDETRAFKVGDSPVTVKLTRAPVYAAPAPEKKGGGEALPGYKGEVPY